MPSGKKYSKEFKLQVINEYITSGLSRLELAKKHNINESSVSHWKSIYEKKGEEGLENRPSIPLRIPKRRAKRIEAKVLEEKNINPRFGPKGLSEHLKRFKGIFLSPATVGKIFKKHGVKGAIDEYQDRAYVQNPNKQKEIEGELLHDIGEWERFERPNPNDLWMMDIMTFFVRGVNRLYLITSMDDHSRFIIGWGLFRDQEAENVLEVLKSALLKYGAPKEILTDRGMQFTAWKGVTKFQKMLEKIGAKHIKASPGHPQTLGKLERYHQSLRRELIDVEVFRSQEEASSRISSYVEHYNFSRAHQGLGGFTPSDRYFGVVEGVKRYMDMIKEPATEGEESIHIGRKPLLYLFGKFMEHDIRIIETAGRVEVWSDGKILKILEIGR
ncbi:MAG: IS481 family transposase [Nitrospinae bacterium]|nr:IS481 family transposase [Nitrospinota bacterium]